MPGVQGRITLVTGAGRGIGRVTAELLASRGARVMAVARSENELQSLGVDFVSADLGTPEGCALAVKETHDRLGPVSILNSYAFSLLQERVKPVIEAPCDRSGPLIF